MLMTLPMTMNHFYLGQSPVKCHRAHIFTDIFKICHRILIYAIQSLVHCLCLIMTKCQLPMCYRLYRRGQGTYISHHSGCIKTFYIILFVFFLDFWVVPFWSDLQPMRRVVTYDICEIKLVSKKGCDRTSFSRRSVGKWPFSRRFARISQICVRTPTCLG